MAFLTHGQQSGDQVDNRSRSSEIRVGIAGTGYVARHFILAFDGKQDICVSSVLTGRPPDHVSDFPRAELLTNDANELVSKSDVVFECSGDPIRAAIVVDAAFSAGIPVVTMNAEFQVTAGSYFADRGLVSEARGDQPGSLAALHERAVDLGFKPRAYVNMKAFMNLDPPLDEMQYWAAKKKVAIDKIISFTDGTKLQIEQALVANGLGATIGTDGLHGLRTSDLDEAALWYGNRARELGSRISDYILFPGAPHGVFVVAEHDAHQHGFLTHIKMGDGPFYVLADRAVLVHLEVATTIRRVVREKSVLLNNSPRPTINVAAVAKRPQAAGARITNAIGSFDYRGSAVKIGEQPNAVPIGLLEDVILKRKIERDQILTFDDVELNDTVALRCWLDTTQRMDLERRHDHAFRDVLLNPGGDGSPLEMQTPPGRD